MLAGERQRAILNMLHSKGSIVVSELSEHFGVSEGTIRRDLSILKKDGLLRKIYGGAVRRDSVRFEPPFTESTEFLEEKKRIGAAAARLVAEGETVFLESGRTTLQLARCLLEKRHIMVVTNGVHIALEFYGSDDIDVFLTGGDIRKETDSLVGPYADRCLEEIRVDKAFMGVSGLVVRRGMTAGALTEAEMKRGIIRCARKVIALADYSKFGKEFFAFVGPLSSVHQIVVDSGVPAEEIEAMKDMGVDVIVA